MCELALAMSNVSTNCATLSPSRLLFKSLHSLHVNTLSFWYANMYSTYKCRQNTIYLYVFRTVKQVVIKQDGWLSDHKKIPNDCRPSICYILLLLIPFLDYFSSKLSLRSWELFFELPQETPPKFLKLLIANSQCQQL